MLVVFSFLFVKICLFFYAIPTISATFLVWWNWNRLQYNQSVGQIDLQSNAKHKKSDDSTCRWKKVEILSARRSKIKFLSASHWLYWGSDQLFHLFNSSIALQTAAGRWFGVWGMYATPGEQSKSMVKRKWLLGRVKNAIVFLAQTDFYFRRWEVNISQLHFLWSKYAHHCNCSTSDGAVFGVSICMCSQTNSITLTPTICHAFAASQTDVRLKAQWILCHALKLQLLYRYRISYMPINLSLRMLRLA